jgi:CRISPR-associated endonuclease/helicase Cas3/CRISPR-associated endonuclease Cas3-HD
MYDRVISHPRQDEPDLLLTEHLRETTERIDSFETFDSESSSSDRQTASVIARLHDFGKASPQFQRYVRDEYHGEQKYTYHARIGALAAYWVLRELGATERDALAGFGAVVKHHGRLPNFATYTQQRVCEPEQTDDDPRQWVRTQIDAIDEQTAETADEILSTASDGAVSWDEFREAFRDGELFDSLSEAVTEQIGFGREADAEQLPERLYDRLLRYWSGLTLADKTCAAGIEDQKLAADHLGIDVLDSHVEDIEGESQRERDLNKTREAARDTVRKNVVGRLLDSDADVGTLTLPTGLGKTFTGITAAYTLRDEIATRRQRTPPRVIYALPYTSIIEQTRETFEDTDIWDADPTKEKFTVHHYLSETITTVDGEEDVDGEPEDDRGPSAAAMLGESWRSGTVLTTFVQLFESLTGPSNSQGMKLPALQDAVVVLDEPQALPKSWWSVVPRLVEILVTEYDVSVVSMTATQPRLFEASDRVEPVSLLDNVEEYYREVRRVTYDIDESVQSLATADDAALLDHETAGERVVSDLLDGASPGDAGPSALAVCNTVGSSRTLTETVTEAADARGREPVHIGDVYEEALTELERDGTQVSQEELLTATLSKLGFAPDSSDEDDEISFVWPRPDPDTNPNPNPNPNPVVIGSLSSQYRPKDRAVFVAAADVLSTSPVPFVFVSTQAIEAGVDLSFQRAYRDLAPLDSVVQTAGRCNRSFEWGQANGEVTIWCLTDPDDPDAPPSEAPVSYVYDSVPGHVDLLADILSELSKTTEIPEIELTRSVVPTYFRRVLENDVGADVILDDIEACRAGDLAPVSLIQGYETIDVFVADSPAEKQILTEIREAFSVGNTPRGFELLQSASDLRVSVSVRDAEDSLPSLSRVDSKPRTDADGVDVLAYEPNAGDGRYDFADGGFHAESGGIGSRFTF